MAYATIPADVETNESAQPLVVNKQTSLKRLVAGAALASFLLGVLAATAVRSASAPLTTSFNIDPDYIAGLPAGAHFDVQLRSVEDGRDTDKCLTLNPKEANAAYLPGTKVIPTMEHCYAKSAHKRGQLFSFEGGVDSPRHLTYWTGGTKLCLATDSDSFFFTPCDEHDKEQDFSFEEVDVDSLTSLSSMQRAQMVAQYGAIVGHIKSKGGKCLGVDYAVKSGISNPSMMECGDDYKEFGDFELYNAWQLIQH